MDFNESDFLFFLQIWIFDFGFYQNNVLDFNRMNLWFGILAKVFFDFNKNNFLILDLTENIFLIFRFYQNWFFVFGV